MADGLSRPRPFKVHQSLHGYVDGHREVAASVRLMPQEIKTVLALSDMSSSGTRIPDHGYLTGYALPESGCYALARTWAATEMPRPGCVWTHTLLIDFADLANLRQAEDLLPLFRRPDAGTPVGYGSPLTIQPSVESGVEMSPAGLSWLRQVLSALYGRPGQRIVITAPPDIDPEPMVLAIWSQQWPRLRRSFCFCTLTTTDRSSKRVTFSLQVLPTSERGVRSRFPDAMDAANVSSVGEAWLDRCLEDIQRPEQSSLREFLRLSGGEVADGRNAFAALIRLHQIIGGTDTSAACIDEATELLEGEFSETSGSALRAALAQQAAKHANDLGTAGLAFLVRHIGLLSESSLVEHAQDIGLRLWRQYPNLFAELLNSDGAGRFIAKATIDELPSGQLIEGLQQIPMLLEPALDLRPDLLSEALFWASDPLWHEVALEELQRQPDFWPSAFRAMIDSETPGMAQITFIRFGAANLWKAIAPALDETPEPPARLLPWLKTVLSNSAVVASVLVEGQLRQLGSLHLVACLTEPDTIPNEYGHDPWLLAMRKAEGSLSGDKEQCLMAYLLSRALGNRSRSCAELIGITFDPVYHAVAYGIISSEAWSLLDRRLPQRGFWGQWDRCKRLRQGIAEIFVDKGLDAGAFGNLSQEDQVFEDLAGTVASRWGGRQYLDGVRQTLLAKDATRFAYRLAVIDGLIGS